MPTPVLNSEIQLVSRLANIPKATQFRRWLAAALEQPAMLVLRVVNAAEARNLNSAFRGKDYPTNVLTFIYHEPRSPLLHGDIVLCAPIVAREAREQGKELWHHYAHLTVHGALHLAGYEHDTPRQEAAMESKEAAILKGLGVADPYQLR